MGKIAALNRWLFRAALATLSVFAGFRLVNALKKIQAADVERTLAEPQNHAPKGYQEIAKEETEHYTRLHCIEDGIERITYTPKKRVFETPIFMQHGMWHGAWCWEHWQALLAEWGWESVAISLPGHAGSPLQKPMKDITLDYYLAFIRDEIAKLERPPVLMGHSMGGALAQWYLRYVNDDLPAVVLVGSWIHDTTMRDGFTRFVALDPVGVLLTFWTETAEQYMRNPRNAAKLLISPNAIVTPEALHAKVGPESALVMMQHNPPYWKPAENVRAPMMSVAGEKDAVIGNGASQETAEYYNAEFVVVPDSGHNIMMDAHYDKTASQIHDWLAGLNIE